MPPDHSSLLSAFPGVRFHPDFQLITWHPHGTLDDNLLDGIAAFIEMREHEVTAPPFHRYADLSGLTDIHLKIGHVFEVAYRRRRSVADLPTVKSAIFSDKIVGFGMARMYETLMEGAAVQVRAFRERQAVAEWLEVSSDLLVEQ